MASRNEPPSAFTTHIASNGWTPGQANRAKTPKPKPKRRLPAEVLTDAEVRALMEACPATSLAGIRNRALIAVLYRAGLRINEALTLHQKDIDAERGAIRVLQAKGGKSRVVGIDQSGMAVLAVWLERRASRGLDHRHPIFCDTNGSPMASGYIRVLLPRLGRKAKIAKRVHAHGLRHTHAAQLREEGIDIGIISKQLGHTSIWTTARYLDHIAPWAVVKAMTQREW